MKRAGSIALTVVLSLVLCVLLFVGGRIILDNPNQRAFDNTFYNDNTVIDEWLPDTDIETVYEERQGDVVNIYNYKFRVPGTLFEIPSRSASMFNYIALESGDTLTVSCSQLLDLDAVKEAITDYYYGDFDGLLTYLPVNVQEDNITCYSQSTFDGEVPILYNEGDETYYMFVVASDVCLLMSSHEMLYLTNDAETVIFGDPSKDPMTYHTYNMYETTAIENTRNKLTDGTYVGTPNDMHTATSQANNDYTSEADNTTRRQMISNASYTWNGDGTSSDTTSTIDITSPTAKASEWVLTTQTSYSYTDNALKLHTLKATRNASMFVVDGSVTNQLSSVRPYVMLIKFLDSDGQLLYVGVVDKRPEPIEGNGVSEWSYTLNSDTGVDLYEVYSLMFELY